jgi:outer membrane receptor protein involved in Fe transport
LRRARAEIAKAVSSVLRSLPLGTPALLLGASPALAETVESTALNVDIPAQPLSKALDVFARQTGVQLIYVSGEVASKSSHAVTAGLGATEALARLLKGTGLRFEYLTSDTIRVLPAASPERSSAEEGELFEVLVTASRREENLQNVPITIQAITGEHLNELSLRTFNDLQKYTTNITNSGNGPGTANIFIRGLGSAGTGNQNQSTIAPFPNVALYLDEQSMQFPARNNDVYMVDLERVEVLEGPQGTLFGGGAQAGAIRYITNKPQLGVTGGAANAAYGTTAGGGPNTTANAVLNLPLGDSFALRGVIFSDHRGGYIDNVSGTISYTPPAALPAGSTTANNAALVETNANPVDYQGLRLSVLWKINDGWDALLQQNYQNVQANGYFYAYPHGVDGVPLGPYQIQAFTPAYTKDRYESTTLTLNGKIADLLSVVYAGSFMVRHIEGQQDYSNYLASYAAPYYACIGTGAGYFNPTNFKALSGKPLQCYPPIATWHDTVKNEHQSHEIRLSTGTEHRARALVGAFWEKFLIDDQMNWNYLAIPQCDPTNLAKAQAGGQDCLAAVGPVPGAWASDPSLRENMNNAFGEDVRRGYKQLAFFVSVDFDIIPKVLTVTAGTRHYHYDEFEAGSVWYTDTSSQVIVDHPNGACTTAMACGFPLNLSKSESGFRSRGSLTWHVTPDVMTYYTFSQGFRPGGFNRVGPPTGRLHWCGPTTIDPKCVPNSTGHLPDTSQYVTPVGYESDDLINNELGLKSELLNHRLLVNASVYRMKWSDVQMPLYQPVNLISVNVNGPSYEINGLELQLIARVTDGLTLQGSSSWNSSKQTTAPCLRSVGITPVTPHNPTPAGECITVVSGAPYTSPFDTLNSSLPFSPPVLFNVRARYDWGGGGFKPFVWVGASHVGSMHNEPANFPDGLDPKQNPPKTSVLRYTIPAYTTYDAALGVAKDNWVVQLTGSNLSNSDAVTNITSAQFIKATIPLRPRVLMAEFGYRF